jgi:hypothetical protein
LLSGFLETYEDVASIVILAGLGIGFVWYLYRVITWKPATEAGEED